MRQRKYEASLCETFKKEVVFFINYLQYKRYLIISFCMQRFISILFFLPLCIFLGILAINPTTLFLKGSISLPFIFELTDIPVIAWGTVFFSLYIIMIWILLKFSNLFSNIKKQKLETEINRLKANIHDGQ